MGECSAGREVGLSGPVEPDGGREPAGRVLLASPHGWCAGVDRAVKTVETALERYGPPVYVRRQIVHNDDVVAALQDRGVVFVEEVSEVPEGAITVFSAHGVAPAVREEAARRGLATIDATCPLVTKVHQEARRLAAADYDIVLIGQAGHDEVVGTTGQAPAHMHLVSDPGDVPRVQVRDPARVAWLSQTTLSVQETAAVVARLRERFPALVDPPSDDICYAAQNRQLAVSAIAGDCDLMLVVGSASSHNSGRLVQVARAAGARAAYLIGSAADIDPRWLQGVSTVGVSSGASAPEARVKGVLAWLAERGISDLREVRSAREHRRFALPPELRRDLRPATPSPVRLARCRGTAADAAGAWRSNIAAISSSAAAA
jgi:4-hydroxy-3-methylbut-2-enyl diphosphate reductase